MKKKIYFYIWHAYRLAPALIFTDMILDISLLFFNFHLIGVIAALLAFILFYVIFGTFSLGQTTYLNFTFYFLTDDFLQSFSDVFFIATVATWAVLVWQSRNLSINLRQEMTDGMLRIRIAIRLMQIEKLRKFYEKLFPKLIEFRLRQEITAELENLSAEKEELKNWQQELVKKPD